MAKIDVSRIEGYAEMSVEDKIKALESFEYEDNAAEVERLRKSASKASSEVGEWKRKHDALLTDEQKKAQEQKEAYESMKNELEALKKEKTVSEHKAKFLALGYSEALAEETASALTDGDFAKVFAAQQTFLAEHDKALKAEALKNTPVPPAGGNPGGVDYTKLASEAMSRGDSGSAAYYYRLQQEANIK